MLAFMLAKYANTVYAIEPLSSLRNFIRKKANKEKLNNIYAIDGFLDLIPFPDNSIDVLMTSNAIGWNLEKELKEIERVVKPNGNVVHLIRTNNNDDTFYHDILTSQKWGYKHTGFNDNNRCKYCKIIK